MVDAFTKISHGPLGTVSDAEADNEIKDLCSSLEKEATQFQSCIALFDHAFHLTNKIRSEIREAIVEGHSAESMILMEQRGVVGNWQIIAAREALSTLYNFDWSLKELCKFVEECRFKHELPKPDGVQKAYDRFNKRFDKALLARHASAHRSEISRNFDKNAHKAALSQGPIRKKKGAKVLFSDNLQDREYTTTRKGELLKFDVSWSSCSEIFNAYNDVISSVATRAWPHHPN